MKILVINAGSSSLKYKLFEMDEKSVLASGMVERIGLPDNSLTHEGKKGSISTPAEAKNHRQALELALRFMMDKEYGVISSTSEIDAVGHRIVHGGEIFLSSVIIDEKVLKVLEDLIALAPLHNPPNITGIKVARELLPHVPHIGTFDTAFHRTLPPKAFLYALPLKYYRRYGIRRYGFHGTSHYWVATRTAEILGVKMEEMKIITCHLGNGCSIAAVKYGKSVDTSMGFTPLEGCVMGTRVGDIDPAIVTFLQEKENLSPPEVYRILYSESGLLGVTDGMSSDMRDIERAAFVEGNELAQLAWDIYVYRIVKYVGAYTAAMSGIDALTFTAGVGENSPAVRAAVASYLTFLGLAVDEEKNQVRGKEAIISTDDSKVKVLTVPTNEELVIAWETEGLLKNGGQK